MLQSFGTDLDVFVNHSEEILITAEEIFEEQQGNMVGKGVLKRAPVK